MNKLEKLSNLKVMDAVGLEIVKGGSKKDDSIPIDSGMTSKKRDIYY